MKDEKLRIINEHIGDLIDNVDGLDFDYIYTNLETNLRYIFNEKMQFFEPKRRAIYCNIIIDRFVKCMTYEEIAKKQHVTRERIRQIIIRICELLKRPAYQEILIYGKELSTENEKMCDLLALAIHYNNLLEEYTNKKIEQLNRLSIDNKSIIYHNVENVGLSNRTTNALLRNGAKTVGDILDYDEFELRKIRGLGPKCIKEIKDFLRDNGFELKRVSYDMKDLDDNVIIFDDEDEEDFDDVD